MMTQYDEDLHGQELEEEDVPRPLALGYDKDIVDSSIINSKLGCIGKLPTGQDLGYGIEEDHRHGTAGLRDTTTRTSAVAFPTAARGNRAGGGGEQRSKQLKPSRVSILGSPDEYDNDNEGNFARRRGGFVSDDSTADYSAGWSEEEEDDDYECRWNDSHSSLEFPTFGGEATTFVATDAPPVLSIEYRSTQVTSCRVPLKDGQDIQLLEDLSCSYNTTGTAGSYTRRRLSSLEFCYDAGEANTVAATDSAPLTLECGNMQAASFSRRRRLSSLEFRYNGGEDTTTVAVNSPPVVNLEYGNTKIASRRLSLNLRQRSSSSVCDKNGYAVPEAAQRKGSLEVTLGTFRLSQRRASLTSGGGKCRQRRNSVSTAMPDKYTSDNQSPSATANRPTRRMSIGLSTPTMSRRRSQSTCSHDHGSLDWWSGHECNSTGSMTTFPDITPAKTTVSAGDGEKPKKEEVQSVIMGRRGSDRQRPTRRISLGYETPTMGLRRRTSSCGGGPSEGSLGSYAKPTRSFPRRCKTDGHVSSMFINGRRMSLGYGVTGTPPIASFRRCVSAGVTPAAEEFQGVVMGRRGSNSEERPIRRVSMGYETPTMGLRRWTSGGCGASEEGSLRSNATSTRSFRRYKTTPSGTTEYYASSIHSRRTSLGCGVVPPVKTVRRCVTTGSSEQVVKGSTSSLGQTCSLGSTSQRVSSGHRTPRMSTSRSDQICIITHQAGSSFRTPPEQQQQQQQQRTMSMQSVVGSTTNGSNVEQQPPISEIIIFASRSERQLSVGFSAHHNTPPSTVNAPPSTMETSTLEQQHQQLKQPQRIERHRRFSIGMSTSSMYSRRRRAASLGSGGGEGTTFCKQI